MAIKVPFGVKNTTCSRQSDWDTHGKKRKKTFSDTYSKSDVQFQPFPSNPTGIAPPSRGKTITTPFTPFDVGKDGEFVCTWYFFNVAHLNTSTIFGNYFYNLSIDKLEGIQH